MTKTKSHEIDWGKRYDDILKELQSAPKRKGQASPKAEASNIVLQEFVADLTDRYLSKKLPQPTNSVVFRALANTSLPKEVYSAFGYTFEEMAAGLVPSGRELIKRDQSIVKEQPAPGGILRN